MNKLKLLAMCVLSLICLVGCNKLQQGDNNVQYFFTSQVLEVEDDYLLLEVFDTGNSNLSKGAKVEVATDVVAAKGCPDFKEGEYARVVMARNIESNPPGRLQALSIYKADETGAVIDDSDSKNVYDDMYIKPSEFSQETIEVLKLFNDEIQFYDVSLNESAKSYDITIWIYRDGEWVDEGKTYGDVKFIGDRIALRLTENSCDIYNITKNEGYSKASYQLVETSFSNSMSKISRRIDNEEVLELNKEVPIWVKIGTDATSFSVSDFEKNFREIECSAGIVITLTVSDKVVE